MKKRHILECLKKYSLSGALRLHMPGHKGKGSLLFDDLKNNVEGYNSVDKIKVTDFGCDVTELSFSDNLINPTGIIKKAEDDIGAICGAKKSFILTGGSSLGVLSMIYAVKNRGKKLIIARSSHKSVYNGLKLCGIEPVFLYEDLKSGLPTPCYTNKNIIENLDNDVIGALITTPDYFGNSADLEYFSNNLKRQNKLLLIDGAHGAHFKFTNNKLYPGNYADIWVDGAHKTLDTFTQGAILHTNRVDFIDNIREALNIFSSSSPSYLIMASVENGVKSFSEIKEETFNEFKKNKEIVVSAFLKKGYKVFKSDDFLKLTIDFNGLCDGNKLEDYFEENGIYTELSSYRFMLMMFSPYFTFDEAKRLERCILSFNGNNCFLNVELNSHVPKREISYVKGLESQFEYVDLKDAKGRICGENAGVFPPCYPLIVVGEVFDNEVIEALSVKNTFGLKNGKVKVLRRK